MKKFKRYNVILATILSILTILVHAESIAENIMVKISDEDIQYFNGFFTDFKKDPKKIMDRLPKKTASSLKKVTLQSIEDKDYVSYKDQIRSRFCMKVDKQEFCLNNLKGRVPFRQNDLAKKLVDNRKNFIDNLKEIERGNYLEAKLTETPWSDDYWALKKGTLGFRYADEQVRSKLEKKTNYTWEDIYNWHNQFRSESYIPDDISFLSPSEKFDLAFGLLGSPHSLTKTMWKNGEVFFEDSGKVEPWMGICHGWAAASFMYPKPLKEVVIKNADGINIIFYPSDIKALGSLLWAEAKVDSLFVGSRCDVKDPEKDEVSGRVLDEDCFDTNPGTWHLVVVNQIGVSKRSFIMDATYDYEVWNQPVVSYDYKYFNVKKAFNEKDYKITVTTDWKKARVRYDKFEKLDLFKDFRKRHMKKNSYIVGVYMKVKYSVEHSPKISGTKDQFQVVNYMYDLEVDRDGTILGGEWYSNAHPDFLWVPKKGSKPILGDIFSINHNTFISSEGQITASKDIKKMVERLNRYGMPFESFVNYLFETSKHVDSNSSHP